MPRFPVTLLASCGLLVLLAGFGGAGEPGLPSDLRIQVELHTYDRHANYAPLPVQSFALTCNPPAGTLPLGRRVCQDIREHPGLMLSATTQDSPCPGPAGLAWVQVDVTLQRGAARMFGGPGFSCVNPGANIYYLATQGNDEWMSSAESRLRCYESPIGDRASLEACRSGFWTRAAEQSIRAATQARAIAALDPAHLFTGDVGAQSCQIPRGGPAKGRTVYGQCGVLVTSTAARLTIVTFVEYWGTGSLTFRGRGFSVDEPGMRHNWAVRLEGNRVLAVTQSGAVPPQLWR